MTYNISDKIFEFHKICSTNSTLLGNTYVYVIHFFFGNRGDCLLINLLLLFQSREQSRTIIGLKSPKSKIY